MAKANEGNEYQREGNIDYVNKIRKNPQGIEQLVSSYFDGFTRTDGKKFPPAGRDEVFYFNLGVPAEHLRQIYSENESKGSSTPFTEIPKFYRDHKGQLKDYNNAQEFKTIASEMTKVMGEISQYASNNYPSAVQTKVEQQFYSVELRNFEGLMAPERVEAAADIIKKGKFQNKSGESFLHVEPIKDYQEALDTANKALQKYKEIADQLKKEPVITYSSVATFGPEGVTNRDLSNAFLRALCDQRTITGLDPKDPEFKTKLASIDPESIKGIELAFKNDDLNQIKSYQISGAKFLEALKHIDPTTLPNQIFIDLKSNEKVEFKQGINVQLTAAGLFKNGEIAHDFKDAAISAPITTPLKLKSQKVSTKSHNIKDRLSKIFRSDKNKDIVFADKAQAAIMTEKLQALETAKATQNSITQSSSVSTNPEQSQSKTIKQSVPEQSTQARDPLQGISNLAVGNRKVESTAKIPATTLAPTPLSKANEDLKQKLQTRPVITQEGLTAKPALKTAPIQTSRPELAGKPIPPTPQPKTQFAPRTVEGPVTKTGMKPLPPIPESKAPPVVHKVEGPLTGSGKKPFPPIPPELAQILKGDGMAERSFESKKSPITPNSRIKIGMRGKKDDTPTH